MASMKKLLVSLPLLALAVFLVPGHRSDVLNSARWGEQAPDGSRLSRFTVTDAKAPRADPKSEKALITWLGGGPAGASRLAEASPIEGTLWECTTTGA
jgi:hypothetical protein